MAIAEVAVFVVRDPASELLLLRRTPQNGGYWHVVAGAVEEGETAAGAAVRELREETGLVAEVTCRYDVVEHATDDEALPAEPGRSVAVAVACFVAHAPSSWEPTLNEEHDDYRWCPWNEAADALTWPGTANALRVLVGARRT